MSILDVIFNRTVPPPDRSRVGVNLSMSLPMRDALTDYARAHNLAISHVAREAIARHIRYNLQADPLPARKQRFRANTQQKLTHTQAERTANKVVRKALRDAQSRTILAQVLGISPNDLPP